MAAMNDSITTRLDFNPVYPANVPGAQISAVAPAVVATPTGSANLIYDPVLNQHVFAQNFPSGTIITAPILEKAKQSVQWLVEHVPTASLCIRGSKVLARRYSDGYYYPATIGSICSDKEGNFIIEFDQAVGNLRMQKTSWFDMISMDDAITHTVQPGDFVIATFEKNGIRYAPGRVVEGQDLDRMGASLKHQGTNYEKESKILVQFGKNLSKNVKASQCVWIPAVVYERLCKECGKIGRRDSQTSHVTGLNSSSLTTDLNASAAAMGLIRYSDIPVLPMPTLPGFYNYPIWNAIQPVLFNGGTYIPTYPYVWHQSLWPHQVRHVEAVNHSTPIDSGRYSMEEENERNLDTMGVLEKIDQETRKMKRVESDDEAIENIISETENLELKEWRAKRALKHTIKAKLSESNCEVVTSSSSSDSSSSSSSDESDSAYPSQRSLPGSDLALVLKHKKKKSKKDKRHRYVPHMDRKISLADASVQINAAPRQVLSGKKFKSYTKTYNRRQVVEKPPWVKYWKHSNRAQINLPKVGYVDPSQMHAAGHSGRFMTQEEKLYSAEFDNAKNMRKIHDKLSQEERSKVRLQQAREHRVMTRLQNDLKKELGDNMPGAAVFTYNTDGDVFKFTKPETTTTAMQAGEVAGMGTQTMREAGGQGVSQPKTYNIGNQTFAERNVAVQVDP